MLAPERKKNETYLHNILLDIHIFLSLWGLTRLTMFERHYQIKIHTTNPLLIIFGQYTTAHLNPKLSICDTTGTRQHKWTYWKNYFFVNTWVLLHPEPWANYTNVYVHAHKCCAGSSRPLVGEYSTHYAKSVVTLNTERVAEVSYTFPRDTHRFWSTSSRSLSELWKELCSEFPC
jgi:hypothetical protein